MADDEAKGEQASTPSEDELLEAKLNAFDEKVKAAGSKRMPDVPDWNYKRPESPAPKTTPIGGIAFGLSLLYTLLSPIVAGFVIGLIVDKVRHTQGSPAIGTLIGMVLGFIAMIIIAGNQMKRQDKK